MSFSVEDQKYLDELEQRGLIWRIDTSKWPKLNPLSLALRHRFLYGYWLDLGWNDELPNSLAASLNRGSENE